MSKIEIPKNGIAGLKANFKNDLIAGFSVSLIALPLCLGIAIASGMPPLAGLITAIIGGIFASRISGTFVTISGPAAGLIVISATAVENLGYSNALGAIAVAGLFVAFFGVLKTGKIGDFFPLPVVHGMLAAIGLIIIIKQLYPALGIPFAKGNLVELATQLPSNFVNINVNATIIASCTLLILILHPFVKVKFIQLIPAPLWVLFFSIPAALLFGIDTLNMVDMPNQLFGEDGFKLPSFSKIVTGTFWVSVVSFALVSGIESLLSAKAVDTLDPYKRQSNLDKDLLAMGLGSSLAASLGGLPMISEIVRSSANINYGAKTQWANFFHGLFLLFYLLIGVVIIEMIPIAALSSMLVYTGFKLASPKEFKHMYKIGKLQLLVFIVTLLAVLATDLLKGIGIGILLQYLLLFTNKVSFKELFKANIQLEKTQEKIIVKLNGSHSFSNYLSLKKQLDKLSKTSNNICIDASKATFINHTVRKHLKSYIAIAESNNIHIELQNFDLLQPLSNHPLADLVKSK